MQTECRGCSGGGEPTGRGAGRGACTWAAGGAWQGGPRARAQSLSRLASAAPPGRLFRRAAKRQVAPTLPRRERPHPPRAARLRARSPAPAGSTPHIQFIRPAFNPETLI